MAKQKDHIGDTKKMMTAVEYLIDELIEIDELTPLGLKVLEKAKQMEKEQIIKAANFLPHDEQNEIKTAEQYYNAKYCL